MSDNNQTVREDDLCRRIAELEQELAEAQFELITYRESFPLIEKELAEAKKERDEKTEELEYQQNAYHAGAAAQIEKDAGIVINRGRKVGGAIDPDITAAAIRDQLKVKT